MDGLRRAILKVMGDDEAPIGAVRLSVRLRGTGVRAQPRTVRAYLRALGS